MEMILIHADGKITKNNRDITSCVLELLGNHIRLVPEFTLASFFMMIQKYPDLKKTSNVLPSLLDIVLKHDALSPKTSELDSLLFHKIIEIRGFPGSPSLNIYNTLKGVCNKEDKELKFFHVETLLGHTFKLGKIKHVVFGDKEDIFQYETVYTLFELVEGISWELSFNFNPLQCSIRR
ncbi:MAG: hypothetical protein ABIJ31_04455 [Pseudomonadota bacterium]